MAVCTGAPFSIRICSRDARQNILEKQHLVGISGEPFAFSGILAMAAATRLSIATICFFGFGLAPTSLQVVYTF
jgi:hypothetical protein